MRVSPWRVAVCGILVGLLVPPTPAQATVGELKKQLQSKESSDRQRAANELSKLGKAATPASAELAAALEDTTPEVRNAAADALGAIGKEALPTLKQALGDNDRRLGALRALEHLGSDAVDLLPAITRCWRADTMEMSEATSKCTLAIGDAAVPHLITLLKDNQLGEPACRVLRDLGPRAKAAVPALLELLRKRGVRGTMEAAAALGPIGDPSAVPALGDVIVLAIDKRDSFLANTAGKAARSLGQLGKPAAAATPVLLRVLGSERRDFEWVQVQGEALMALEAMANGTPEVLAALRAFLAASPGDNKGAAERLLKKLGG